MNNHTNSHQPSHERIAQRLNEHIKDTPQHSTMRSIYMRYRAHLVSCVLLSIGLFCVLLSGYQMQRVSRFSEVIGRDVFGFMWMYMADVLLLGIILCIIGFVVHIRREAINTVNQALDRFAPVAIAFAFVLILGLTGSVEALEPAITSMQQSPLKSAERDQYIVSHLDTNNEYFGAVVSDNCKQIQIDHGGIVRVFEYNRTPSCTLLLPGNLVWIKYDDTGVIQKKKV